MFSLSIYKKSPILVQNTLLSLRALVRKKLRETPKQKAVLLEIEKNERDQNFLDSFVTKKMKDVLSSAKDNVPFYKNLDGVDVDDVNSFPIIHKSLVSELGSAFNNESHKGVVVNGSTSGTTGSPLKIKQSMDSVVREQAFVSRHLNWAGYKPGDKRAWIRGDIIVPLSQKKGPYWRYSWFENMIMLSSYHMKKEVLQDYLDAMVDYQVDIIQANPSSIIMLAKYLEVNNDFYQGKLKSIITSSESFSPEDKRLVEERFKCTVFDWYGLFERVAAIGSCEYGNYHILTDYSHVELIEHENGKHEIVGTNFNNNLTPLIRYKTGDFVSLSEQQTCKCGRVFPIIDKIEGRVNDFLISEGGQKVFILSHTFAGVKGIIAGQFLQESKSSIEIKVVADVSLFVAVEKTKLIANAKARLGESMNIIVTVVNEIPKTRNGKVKLAICNVEG
ncbi:phenylacetate--CoA ligase family protein [Motilimonas pumila]|uniref:Phenylacetate--CoA ligase family protein n=1 Tax=Motilimonas pumila TaxID=2303987 RepID=A0A418YLF2_9GAMM|nr:phenylacetate--CoA ligase family protein [Motilimonas pumila]RJG51630.1 phenylacetate--CoA ligase family protein [Motilimonas pumila]